MPRFGYYLVGKDVTTRSCRGTSAPQFRRTASARLKATPQDRIIGGLSQLGVRVVINLIDGKLNGRLVEVIFEIGVERSVTTLASPQCSQQTTPSLENHKRRRQWFSLFEHLSDGGLDCFFGVVAIGEGVRTLHGWQHIVEIERDGAVHL